MLVVGLGDRARIAETIREPDFRTDLGWNRGIGQLVESIEFHESPPFPSRAFRPIVRRSPAAGLPDLLQHPGPSFFKRHKVEHFYFPRTKLPFAPALLVLVVQPPRANHALLALHRAVLEATRPARPAVAAQLNHVIGEERPHPHRPGVRVKVANGLASTMRAATQ